MSLKRFFFWSGEAELFAANRDAVNDYVYKILKTVSIVMSVALAGLLAFAFAFSYPAVYKKVYFSFFVVSAVLMAISCLKADFSKRHANFLCYILFAVFFSVTLGANFSSPHKKEYVSMICAIFFVPTLLMDRSLRINLFVGAFALLSGILSYYTKPAAICREDILNLCLYSFVGITLGAMMRKTRIKGFDTERVLDVERNTDSLTKLSNRRMLFEHLRRGVENEQARPTGIFMIDIDKFKQFNDSYGHRAGDVCLNAIGRCFEDFGGKSDMKFFRYGGEEFCALCWSKDYNALSLAANALLEEVRALKIPFNLPGIPRGIVTISVGYAFFERGAIPYDFEGMIKSADAALYAAKELGRDCAVGNS